MVKPKMLVEEKCNFCGKPRQSVKHLVYANLTFICDECVTFAHDIINGKVTLKDKGT